MNNEFFEALELLEKEKGISADYLLEKITAAIAIAVKRDFGGSDNALVEIDPETRKFSVAVQKDVVEEVARLASSAGAEGAYEEIESDNGHDSFLIDFDQLDEILRGFWLRTGF